MERLRIVSWNIASANKKSKTEQLRQLAETQKPHIILLQETFLNPSIKSPTIQGYEWHRKDRLTDKRGGVAILIHESVNFIIQPNPPHIKSAELVGGFVKTEQGQLYVASLYLPPDKGRKRELGAILKHKRHFFIGGDLNAHWEPWGHSKSNNTGSYLDFWVQELQLNIHIPPEKTRVHPKRPERDSVLDYGLTHELLTQVQVDVLPLMDSDHRPVSFNISDFNLKTPRNIRITRHWEGIATDINFQEWPDGVEATAEGITEDVATFNLNMQAIMLNNSKAIKIPHHRKRLLPREIRILQKEKQNMLKKFHEQREASVKKSINQITRRITSEIKNWEEEKKVELLSSINDPDTRWRTIQQTNNTNARITTLLGEDNAPAYSNNDKAELIAKSLANRFTELTTNTPNPEAEAYIPPQPDPSRVVPVIQVADVVMATKASKKGTSPGHDGIPYRAIQLLNSRGFNFITQLFNAILISQFYPDDWKKAVIVPLPKEGKDPHNPGNYRPISLTPCLAKIYEKCLLPHLQAIEREKGIIPDSQMGFRAKHSTTHQLTRTSEHLIRKWNEKVTSLMVSLDIEAAFDKVPHKYLLFKLHKFGYPDWVIAFLTSYFHNRSFIVKVGDDTSEPYLILAGTPQGAILSPFLYNNFISDMPAPPEGYGIMSQYADDTAYIISSKHPEEAIEIMQRLLDELLAWCELWKTKINAGKSQVLLFYPHTHKRRQRPNINLTYNAVSIPEVETLKYLGIHFDKKLQWDHHIKISLGKAKQRTAILTKTIFDKNKLNEETRKLIYTALIRPIITYGAPCWLGAAMAYKRDLIRYDRNWLRHIFKIPRIINPANVYRTVDQKIPHLQLFLHNLALKFQSSVVHHQNSAISALCDYDVNFNLHGRRPNQYKRNFPLQVPIDITRPA